MIVSSSQPDGPAPLSPEEKYALLETAAVRLNVRIRVEKLDEEESMTRPRGGLIRLGGERIVILDRQTPLEERILVLARGLNRALVEQGEEFGYLPPAVRLILAQAQEGSPI